MDITILHLSVPKELADLLGAQRQADETAREFIVLGLYQDGRISGGKAAEFLGLTRRGFISLLTRKGLDYFRFTLDEWANEGAAVKIWSTRRV